MVISGLTKHSIKPTKKHAPLDSVIFIYTDYIFMKVYKHDIIIWANVTEKPTKKHALFDLVIFTHTDHIVMKVYKHYVIHVIWTKVTENGHKLSQLLQLN